MIMGGRKHAMGVGTIVERRIDKKVGKVIDLGAPILQQGKEPEKSFVVQYYNDASTETIATTKVQRHKPNNDGSSLSQGSSRPPANNVAKSASSKKARNRTRIPTDQSAVVDAPTKESAPNKGNSERAYEIESCILLRANGRQDERFRSLDLQSVMCSNCETNQPQKCIRSVEFIDMFKKQKKTEIPTDHTSRSAVVDAPAEESAPNNGNSDGVCENKSCIWLRENGTQDEEFGALELQYVMCSHCEANQPEKCNRSQEFIDMFKKQKMRHRPMRCNNKKHEPRLSYDTNHTYATGVRKVASQTTSTRERVVKAMGLITARNVDTPSKWSKATRYRAVAEAREFTGVVLRTAYPHMNDDGRHRILAQALDKPAQAADRTASKQLKSNAHEMTNIGLREKAGTLLLGMRPMLQTMTMEQRRPWMAYLYKETTLKHARELTGIDVKDWEWKRAGRHAAYPGPMLPVIPILITRQRCKRETVDTFMELLSSNFLQAHAVGMSQHTYVNGEEQIFDNLSTTTDTGTINREYGKFCDALCEKDGIELPPDEDRCSLTNPKNGVRCMLRKGHKEGTEKCRCKFTPPSGLSSSSIEKLVAAVASSKLKSLAGLDDEDVIKGHLNFKHLTEIATELCRVLEKSKSDTDALINAIKDAKTFSDTEFVMHCSRDAEHICGCLSCGFTAPQHEIDSAKGWKRSALQGDYVECQYRANNSHKGPCKKCEASFALFRTLLDYANEATTLPDISDFEREGYNEMLDDIVDRRQMFIELRSHKVRKKTESDFDRQQHRELGPNDCIVICDFKMKILAIFHREYQKLFYGKRGITCLGFMVIIASSDGQIDVHYYLFFSDNTTQDANFVLSAKAALYTEILPSLFKQDFKKINVHFRSDGAGCFNCAVAKSVMPKWHQWTVTSGGDTPVDEVSYRVSVNGGGKTTLDACFGQTGCVLKTAVNNGRDITSAESCFEAFMDSSGVAGTTAALFNPCRDVIIEAKKNPGLSLKQFYHLKRNPGAKSVQGFSHSGFGSGTEISEKSVESILAGDASSLPMPSYTFQAQPETEKSSRTLKHSTETRAGRDKRKQETKSALRKKKRDDTWTSQCQAKRKRGIFACSEADTASKERCICEFLSEAALEAHRRSGKHKYRSQNLVDSAVTMVASAGGIMAAGTRSNRLPEYSNITVEHGEGSGGNEDKSYYYMGWARKGGRKQASNFTNHLTVDLLGCFIDGATADGGNKKGKSKYMATEALEKLKAMKHEGLRKYSRRSPCGELPSVDQIRQHFGQYNKLHEEKGIEGLMEKLDDLKMRKDEPVSSECKLYIVCLDVYSSKSLSHRGGRQRPRKRHRKRSKYQRRKWDQRRKWGQRSRTRRREGRIPTNQRGR